ncbi:MFS transporter (plasmid) [Nicoliella spurrieriana]|uniref:MFS transporter n=1 Tax=Nicoliella spurrieriana TaxID=2925830 RepID=A0A976RQI7_9LACO|nr:MFS transporter [Nicoliella spurrieriana]UQS86015.1 MFS transporter [Nicoliella spurrieriana]
MNQIRLRTRLFLNYFVHGFALIILTQNLIPLAQSWGSSLAVASFVLSGIGIGRLIAYLIMGFISDRFGRKTTLMIGMLTYLVFFIVTPLNHSLVIAYGMSIIAGVGNSALDSATYPLFSELDSNNSSNSILLKAFISVGEFCLPIIILFLKGHQLWFGISFLIPAIVLVINIINIASCKFPKFIQNNDQVISKAVKMSKGAKALITGSLFVYGFTSMAVMIWFTQWITIFATKIGFSDVTSHLLLSLYSIGSITGVLLSFAILKRFDVQRHVFLGLNIVSVIAIATVSFSHSPYISSVAAFAFGLSAAGGLMQVALNQLLSLYNHHKGIFTGIFFMFGSIASFSIPIITGFLIRFGEQNILTGDIVVALVGLVAAIITFLIQPKTNQLDDARAKINQIDAQLVSLLEQRFKAVKDVQNFKQEHQLPTEDQHREADVLAKIKQLTSDPELVSYNQNIIQNIMNNSKQYQTKLNQNQ